MNSTTQDSLIVFRYGSSLEQWLRDVHKTRRLIESRCITHACVSHKKCRTSSNRGTWNVERSQECFKKPPTLHSSSISDKIAYACMCLGLTPVPALITDELSCRLEATVTMRSGDRTLWSVRQCLRRRGSGSNGQMRHELAPQGTIFSNYCCTAVQQYDIHTGATLAP